MFFFEFFKMNIIQFYFVQPFFIKNINIKFKINFLKDILKDNLNEFV